jgi:hypothetical protein
MDTSNLSRTLLFSAITHPTFRHGEFKQGTYMTLNFVPISAIVPNSDNPRGIDIQTEDPKLSYLKDSIAKFGVLVPIVVTPRRGKMLLIDGERRYHAAKAVGLKKLPAFTITGEHGATLRKEELLFRMFQIHHLREQWGPVQQCAALEDAYQEVVKRREIRNIKDQRTWVKAVADELAAATGIEDRTALDRVKFLRWPTNVKVKLYHKPEDAGYWYICEIEEKIIIPAQTNYPEYFEQVSVDEVRRDLYKKLTRSLERATDVRKVAPYFRVEMTKPIERRRVQRVLEKLRSHTEMTYEDARQELEQDFPDLLTRDPPSPKKLLNLIVSLQAEVERFDVAAISKAQRRARANPNELLEAVGSLQEYLEGLAKELKGAGK